MVRSTVLLYLPVLSIRYRYGSHQMTSESESMFSHGSRHDGQFLRKVSQISHAEGVGIAFSERVMTDSLGIFNMDPGVKVPTGSQSSSVEERKMLPPLI